MKVYKITNKLNEKYYIGVTNRTFEERFKEHKNSDSYIGNALRKYGEENFDTEIIFEGNEESALSLEHELIDDEISNSSKTYNQTPGGGLPPKATEESSKKSAETRKELIGLGVIPPPPKLSKESQKKSAQTRKRLMEEGKISKPPIISPESQLKAAATRKRLFEEGKIDYSKDKNLYEFLSSIGELVEYSRKQMKECYGISSEKIRHMLNGGKTIKDSRGVLWALTSLDNHLVYLKFGNRADLKNYVIYNGDQKLSGLIYDLVEQTGVSYDLLRSLINGKREKIKGWKIK